MADAIATRDVVLNYSGMLFDKGNNATPLTSLIRNRRRSVQTNNFVIGQYTTATAVNTQPEISEIKSLTAPDATVSTRQQMENVTQAFHESVYVSYMKQADANYLSGVNTAGSNNPIQDELGFQAGRVMLIMSKQVEYTFVNGVYQKATSAGTANKTRGLIPAITTNVVAGGGKYLRVWNIIDMAQKIADQGGDTSNLTIMVPTVQFMQLMLSVNQSGFGVFMIPESRFGINLRQIETPYGTFNVMKNDYVPKGTAVLMNSSILEIVEQPTPTKGNFFYEELAKVGAGTKGQIFGLLGLDHGAEWFHAKTIGLDATFTPPTNDFISVNQITTP